MTTHRPTIDPTIGPTRDPYASGDPTARDGGVVVPLEQEIAALLGSNAQRLFHSLDASKFDSLTAVGSWSPSIGSGAATQSTGTVKPAYSASAINGRPGLAFDGGDLLETAAIDLSTFEFLALAIVMESANGAVVFVPSEFGSLNAGDNGGVRLLGHEVANNLAGSGKAASGTATTRAASAMTASPCVFMATVDYSLTTHCVEVYKNGVLVSTTYPGDPDMSAQAGANKPLYLGNRAAADLGLSGDLGAALLAAYAATPTAAQLAALLESNRALMRAYGIS